MPDQASHEINQSTPAPHPLPAASAGGRFLTHVLFFLRCSVRRIIYRLRFGPSVQVSPTAHVARHSVIRITPGDRKNIVIGANCWIEDDAKIITYGGDVVIGAYSSVNDYTLIRGGGGVQIGDYVRIGPHCTLSGTSHVFDRTDIPIYGQGLVKRPIVVEDDVWIGANTVVIDGVTIKRGSVIGAGSVVTHDIPEYSLAAGCPARVLRNRKQEGTDNHVGS